MDAFHIRRLRDRVIYYDVRASCWRPLVKTTATRSSAEDWAASGDNRAHRTSRGKEPPAPHAHAFSVTVSRYALSQYGTVPGGFGCRGRSVQARLLGLGRGGATARRRRAGCRPVAKRSRTVRGRASGRAPDRVLQAVESSSAVAPRVTRWPVRRAGRRCAPRRRPAGVLCRGGRMARRDGTQRTGHA